MATVGVLEEFSGEFAVYWRIKGFLSLPADTDTFYVSPEFLFAGACWRLQIYPNGRTNIISEEGSVGSSEGFIDLYLRRESSGPPIKMEYKLGLKIWSLKENSVKLITCNIKKTVGDKKYGIIRRSKLFEGQSENYFRKLVVFCNMQYSRTAGISSYNAAEKCSYCKMILDADEDLSSHQQNCKDKPIKCPECNDVIALKNWYDHKCQITRAEVSEKLLHDFKTLMVNGDHSDTIFKVKGEEFPLHRNIFAARNPYFDSMFKNELKEKTTGVVTIEDCEPDTFRSFIHFVYTGRVDKLSPENVCDLYEIAFKYQEDELKNECSLFMRKTLSVDNFGDYFVLSLRHDEKELFQKGTELFTVKGKEISRSVKWQVFVRDYPTQANELFIKTLDHYIK